METTKKSRTTKPSRLLSTLLSSLSSLKCQLCPQYQGRIGHATERDTERGDIEGEVGHVLEGGGGKFEQDTGEGTASVSHKVDPTKSG